MCVWHDIPIILIADQYNRKIGAKILYGSLITIIISQHVYNIPNRWRWNQECCFCCGCCVRERELLAIKLVFWPVSKWLSEIKATLPRELNAYTASTCTTILRFGGKILPSKIYAAFLLRISNPVNSFSKYAIWIIYYTRAAFITSVRLRSIENDFQY